MKIFKYMKDSSREKYGSLTAAQGREENDSDFSKKKDINDTKALEQVAWRGCKKCQTRGNEHVQRIPRCTAIAPESNVCSQLYVSYMHILKTVFSLRKIQ